MMEENGEGAGSNSAPGKRLSGCGQSAAEYMTGLEKVSISVFESNFS